MMTVEEAHKKIQNDPVAQRILAALKAMQKQYGKAATRKWLANWEEKKLADGSMRPEAVRDFVALIKFECGL